MARQPRLCVPGLPHLVLLQAAATARPLAQEAQRWRFLAWLIAGVGAFPVRLHAYCVLPDAVWLLLTPESAAALSGLMQMLARRASRVAQNEMRTDKDVVPQAAGSDSAQMESALRTPIWAGRFRSAVLQPREWLLPSMIWVDTAAQRAGLAPAEQPWAWSSHAVHCGLGAAGGGPTLDAPQPYWLLGNTPFEREAAYLQQLQKGLDPSRITALQQALRRGVSIGDDVFLDELEKISGRAVRPKRRGRPRKNPAGAEDLPDSVT